MTNDDLKHDLELIEKAAEKGAEGIVERKQALVSIAERAREAQEKLG